MENLKKFKKIVILGGGISDEKEISDLTSKEVYKTLKNKYDVSLIDVTQNCEKLIKNLLNFKPDVVFNCLHGFFGEDGQVQSILNYLKIKYTHSGVMTSSVLMNKEISLRLLALPLHNSSEIESKEELDELSLSMRNRIESIMSASNAAAILKGLNILWDLNLCNN